MTVGCFGFGSSRTLCGRSVRARFSLTNAETRASSPARARERGPRATRAEGRAGWAPGSCGLAGVPPAPMSESPGRIPAVCTGRPAEVGADRHALLQLCHLRGSGATSAPGGVRVRSQVEFVPPIVPVPPHATAGLRRLRPAGAC